jgi:tRNA(Arg) A34 adenosine deaminase TadA
LCKEVRCLKMAARVAEQSGYDTFRHGAVLIRGGSVLNVAANSNNHTSFGQRFRTEPGRATHHAETACVLGLDKSATLGGTIYVARIGKAGDWKSSKPCSMCHEVMSFVGIKRVVYTLGPNEWDAYKIEDEDEATIGY